MSSQPTYEEKYAKGLEFKDAGNKFFVAGEYKKALQQYHSATTYLAGLDRDRHGAFGAIGGGGGLRGALDPSPDSGPSESKKQLSMVQSNMAACLLKLERYERAYQCSTDALKHDSKNVKAHFRKCTALRLMGDFHKAETALEEFIKEHPAQKADYDAEMKFIKAERQSKQRAADSKLKGFLQKK